MENFKKGDIVGRNSYGKDILFKINDIIDVRGKKIALLKGIVVRIEADAPVEDLVNIEKEQVNTNIRKLEQKLEENIKICGNIECKKKSVLPKRNFIQRRNTKKLNGKILHLDGDSNYAQKSLEYYKKLGLNAIVKNIPENQQSVYVFNLLRKYKPDILIITGHDGMIKRERDFNDIYNYRNSRHFMKTIKMARLWGETQKELVIFAGACQSYYEALISAGANFASSPGRVFIDFIDPLVVARVVATTDNSKYVTIDDMISEIKEGKKAINGERTQGKRKEIE